MSIVEKIECTYVPLTESNMALMIPLFKQAFKKEVSLDELKKKYDHSIYNKPYLGLYAFHNGLPIAFIGICYYKAKYKGTEEWASNFTDSMVHPDYQGKSVYIKLLSKVQELAKENGICFSLGFPNDKSFYPVVNKGKWDIAINMVGFMIEVKSFPWRRAFRKLGLEGSYLNHAKKILKPFEVPYHADAFAESDEYVHMVHDTLFYTYRDSPSHFLLNIEGIYVWIKLGTQLTVGFLGDIDEKKMLLVVTRLQELAKKLYIQQVMLQFTKGANQASILSKHYTSFESWPVLYSNQQSTFPKEKLRLQYCDVDSF